MAARFARLHRDDAAQVDAEHLGRAALCEALIALTSRHRPQEELPLADGALRPAHRLGAGSARIAGHLAELAAEIAAALPHAWPDHLSAPRLAFPRPPRPRDRFEWADWIGTAQRSQPEDPPAPPSAGPSGPDPGNEPDPSGFSVSDATDPSGSPLADMRPSDPADGPDQAAPEPPAADAEGA
jgi:hypothetical protein